MKDKLFHVPKRWACEVCLTRVKTEPADDHSSSPLRISQEEVRGSKVRLGGQQLSQTSRSKGVQMGKVKFIPTEEVIKLRGINVRTTSCTQTPSSKRVPPAPTSTKPPIPSGRKENVDSSCTRSGRPRVTGNLNPSSRCLGRSQDAQLFISSSKLVELPESRHKEKDGLEADRTSEKDSSTMPCEKEHANGDVSNREVGMPDIQANEASPAGLDAPMFLWGVFRQMKNKRPPPPLPATCHLSSHIDSDSQPHNTPNVGSSEAEDMEIDMIGGVLIGNIDNIVKKPIVLEMGKAIDSHGSSSVERRRVSFKIDKPSPSRKRTVMDHLEPKLPFSSQGCSEQAASGCQDDKKRVKKVIDEEMVDYDDMPAPPGFPEPLHGEQNYSSLGAANKAEETQQAENKVSDPQKSPMRSTIGSPTWTEWDKRHKSATGSSSNSNARYRCVRHSELDEIKSSANIRSRKKEDARIIDMSKLQEKSCVVSDRANQILSRARALNSDLRSSLERDGEHKSFSRFFGPCVNDASPTFKSYYDGISLAADEVQKKQAMDADSSNLKMTSNQVGSVCQGDKRFVKKVIKEEIGDYDDLFAPPGFPEPLYREPNYSSLGAAKKAEETLRAEDRVNSNSNMETRSPEPTSSQRASKGSFVPAPGEPVRYSNWSPRQVPDSQKSPMMCSTFGSPTWPEWEKKHKSSTGSSSNSSAGYRCTRDSELGEIKSSANIRSRKEGARIIDMSKLQEKSHVKTYINVVPKFRHIVYNHDTDGQDVRTYKRSSSTTNPDRSNRKIFPSEITDARTSDAMPILKCFSFIDNRSI
ncbi:hypothetical protein QJS10_CPA10g01968 [Acorus calamus]|uniref:Uncharacterized protein n=1 Tax=Acorus calamus TaxID=4465 RepID=A0AAV9DY02_ACOCL|nr:hypothetical protein QJS10_CPA10g01968 [Acorus calamus]